MDLLELCKLEELCIKLSGFVIQSPAYVANSYGLNGSTAHILGYKFCKSPVFIIFETRWEYMQVKSLGKRIVTDTNGYVVGKNYKMPIAKGYEHNIEP